MRRKDSELLNPSRSSFTQNVDALELMAGMHEDKLVEAHGSARGAHCLGCRKGFSRDWFADKVRDRLKMVATEFFSFGLFVWYELLFMPLSDTLTF